MKFLSMAAAEILSIFSGASVPADNSGASAKQPEDEVSAKLKGTWLKTVQLSKDHPRTTLTFEGKTVRFEKFNGNSGSAEYKIIEKKPDSFRIKFEFSYKVDKGYGHIVEFTDSPELMFHVENGRAILSEMMFECDGRGEIIMNEYLREDEFIDGFASELRHELNDRPIPRMTAE